MTTSLPPEAVEVQAPPDRAFPELAPGPADDAEGRQYAGLTPLEAAAARTHPHMSVCDRPSRMDCVDCADELHQIRKYVAVIEAEVDREADDFYVGELCEFIYRNADTSEAVMHAEQFSVDELAELVNAWRPRAWQTFLAAREPTAAPRHAAPEPGQIIAASQPRPDTEGEVER